MTSYPPTFPNRSFLLLSFKKLNIAAHLVAVGFLVYVKRHAVEFDVFVTTAY